MSKLTKEELKQKFKTGDKPTEKDFSDLIDSIPSKEDFTEMGLPIISGDKPNSAILSMDKNSLKNRAVSETAMAVGASNISGLTGWYYGAISEVDDTTIDVYLVKSQPILPIWGIKTVSNPSDANLLTILGRDTIVSLINDSKYDNYFRVIDGSEGVVRLSTVDGSNIPFKSISVELDRSWEDYSVYCLELPDKGEQNLSIGSFAEGYMNQSLNGMTHAEGFNTKALGKFAHTEGRDTVAMYLSHAEGSGSKAMGLTSHAEGTSTEAVNSNAHSEGRFTRASGYSSHAEGMGESAEKPNEAGGGASHVEGYANKALALYSHAEGTLTVVTEEATAAHAEGEKTEAGGKASHVEGMQNKAYGLASHSEGRFTRAHGLISHAEGMGVDGKEEDYGAFGPISHTEGYATKTYPEANSAHAEGRFTEARNLGEHASGVYNKSTASSDNAKATLFSIGNGTSETSRSNAVEVKKNGDIYIIGIGGYDGKNYESAQTLQEVLSQLN